MPTVLTLGPYRIEFFGSDQDEPPHVHVKRDRCEAKFWLKPIRCARNKGYAAHELNVLCKIVEAHQAILLEKWNAHFRRP